MHALILAGGKGTRLRPITDYMPKALVPINNIPIIEWQIKYLQNHGVRDIIVSSGYGSDLLSDFLQKRTWRSKLRISDEMRPLGTAGAVRNASRMIRSKSLLVLNGDVITDIDVCELAKRPNSLAAIPLRTRFGVLEIRDDRIAKFKEKKHVPDVWMNAGIYCLEKKSIRDMPEKGDLEKTIFPDYARRGMLHAVKFGRAQWHSIDSFKDLEECSARINKIIK